MLQWRRQQRKPIAGSESGAKSLLAADQVVDAVAVADTPAVSGAKTPDAVLDHSRKARRKGRIEFARVDALGERGDDLGTAARSVAGWPVVMLGVQALKTAGSSEEGVNERVYGDEARSCRGPALAFRIAAKQQLGENH